jgi:hypothetical protein
MSNLVQMALSCQQPVGVKPDRRAERRREKAASCISTLVLGQSSRLYMMTFVYQADDWMLSLLSICATLDPYHGYDRPT